MCCHSVQFTVRHAVMSEISNENILGFVLYITGSLLDKNVHLCAVFIQIIFSVALTWSTEHSSLRSFLLNFPWSFLYWNGCSMKIEEWHILLFSSPLNVIIFSLCRQDFVDAYVDYIFNKSVASLFSAFHEGFHKVCGGKVLQLFQPSELQSMVIGNTNYDWKELEKVKTNKQHSWLFVSYIFF